MAIKLEHGVLNTNTKQFRGHVEVDASDGDPDSLRLLEFLEELFEKAQAEAERHHLVFSVSK